MRNFTIYLLITVVSAYTHPHLNAAEPTGYRSVTGPCHLEFPKDHGPHPGYRTEWWYYTGNLQASSGNKYGFQLTFFRSQTSPPAARRKWPQPASAWRTQQVYVAHAAIAHIAEKRHLQAELLSREALNMAGASQDEDTTTVFIKDWSLKIGSRQHLLEVNSEGFSYKLSLTPQKPPVVRSMGAYNRGVSTVERASCYYSFTRLNVAGKLLVGDNVVPVKGSAWMDHEYGTDIVGPDLKGWDWFSLQLSDQTEIMAYVLRDKTGGIGTASSATVIDSQGKSRHIPITEFAVTVRSTWKSPHSKTVYPAGWQLKIFSGSIDLIIKPRLADQEMITSASTGITYWEGSVSIEGSKAGQRVEGQGYVELTGYARPFDAPM